MARKGVPYSTFFSLVSYFFVWKIIVPFLRYYVHSCISLNTVCIRCALFEIFVFLLYSVLAGCVIFCRLIILTVLLLSRDVKLMTHWPVKPRENIMYSSKMQCTVPVLVFTCETVTRMSEHMIVQHLVECIFYENNVNCNICFGKKLKNILI